MDNLEKPSYDWMGKFTRNPNPKSIIWRQDNVTHPVFYWLAVETPKEGMTTTAIIKDQSLTIRGSGQGKVYVRLNDAMVDLSKPIAISLNKAPVKSIKAVRTLDVILRTLLEKKDPNAIYSAEITL